MIGIQIKGLKETTKFLNGTPRQMAVASTRAIRSTLAWTKTRIKRDGAKALKAPQKAITSRILTQKIRNGATSGKLWAGTWNISPFAVGVPQQIGGRTSKGKAARSRLGGVGVGRSRFYRGAFLGNVYGGKPSIWIRKSSRHYTPSMYGGKPGRTVSGRFPVTKATIRIDDLMTQVFDRDEGPIRAEFHKRLQKEINYAVNVEGWRK